MRAVPAGLLALVAVIALCVVTLHAATGSYSCAGSTTADIATLDANWVKKIGNTKQASNVCQADTAPSIYLYNISVTQDQFAKLTSHDQSGGNGGPMVRIATDGGDASGYFAYVTATTVQIYKRSGASNNTQGASYSQTLAVDDIFELRATGGATTTFDVLKNGSSLGTRTDSSSAFTTGQTGFYNSSQQFKDWSGGDLGGAAPTTYTNLPLLGVGMLLFHAPWMH